MIRSQLARVVEMGTPLLDAHRRTGNLPFDTFGTEGNEGTRKWASYTLHHAANLIAARWLADHQGVTWSEAAAILRDPGTVVSGNLTAHDLADDRFTDSHVVRVEFATVRGAEPGLRKRFSVYRGALEAALYAAASAVAYENERARFAEDRIRIASVVSVSLSLSYAIARRRMAELGIEETDGFDKEVDE